MGKPADKRRRQYLVAAGIVGLVAASLGWMPVAIAAEETAELSLKQVPANVAFYTSMLRNREQIEAIAKSKAWAKLMGMPAVQELLKHVHAQLDTPQAAPVKQFFQAPENKQLLELLADLASNEIYVYGGDTFLTTADLVGQVAGGMRFQPLMRSRSTGRSRARPAAPTASAVAPRRRSSSGRWRAQCMQTCRPKRPRTAGGSSVPAS